MQGFTEYLHGTAVLYPEVAFKVPNWITGDFAILFTSKRIDSNKKKGDRYFQKKQPAQGDHAAGGFEGARATDSLVVPKGGKSLALNSPSEGRSVVQSSSRYYDREISLAASTNDMTHQPIPIDLAGESGALHYSDSDEEAERKTLLQRSKSKSKSRFTSHSRTWGGEDDEDVTVSAFNLDDGAEPKRHSLVSLHSISNSYMTWRSAVRSWHNPFCRPKPKRKGTVYERRRGIEPKTFLANERTYLKWFGASVFIASVSCLALTTTGPMQNVGYVFLPIAILVLVYATLLFRQRVWFLEDREPSFMYSDLNGPVVLTIVLLLAFVLSAVISQTPPALDTVVKLDGADTFVQQSCFTSIALPANMAVLGLTLDAKANTLYGVDDGFLFRAPLASGNVEFTPIVVVAASNGTEVGARVPAVVADLRGVAVVEEEAWVGSLAAGIARVYVVDLGTNAVTSRSNTSNTHAIKPCR